MNIFSFLVIFVLSVIYAWSIYSIPFILVGVKCLRERSSKKEIASLSKKDLPFFSITVPVKNEEKVIGRLLDSLLKLDYPPEKREIIIVEDGSTDKTKEICMDYALRYPNDIVFLSRSMSIGKPSALNYALKHSKGEIVAVFDADSVLERDVLLRVVKYFENPSVAAVQGRAYSINADENMLTKLLSYEEAVRFEAYIRGKDALNLYVPLAGNCEFIRKSVLESVGGWNEESLSEDIDISIRITKEGHRIRYAPDVILWQENPATLTQLVKQRTRWYRGEMEVLLKHGRLLTHPNKKNVDAEITLLCPLLLVLCLAGYIMGMFAFVLPFDQFAINMTKSMWILNVLALSAVGAALLYVTKLRKVKNLLWLPFIYMYWSLQILLSSYTLLLILLRRHKVWAKTVKNGTMTDSFFKFYNGIME